MDNSGPIEAPFLLSELRGFIEESDYPARSTQALKSFEPTNETDDPDRAIGPTSTFGFEEAYLLEEPGYLDIENGFVRRPDGSFFIACLTNLGEEINGEMFDWWLRNCDENEKFVWSHPNENKFCTWDPNFYAAMPYERPPYYYVEHTQYIEKVIGGDLNLKLSLQVEYMRAAKYFDTNKFPEKGITCCTVGEIYSNDPVLGVVGYGHIVNMVRKTGDRTSELRTRIWLGNIRYPERLEKFLYARWVNYTVSFPLYKMMKITNAHGKALFHHFSQQYECLKHFLPHYYSKTTEKNTEKKTQKTPQDLR